MATIPLTPAAEQLRFMAPVSHVRRHHPEPCTKSQEPVRDSLRSDDIVHGIACVAMLEVRIPMTKDRSAQLIAEATAMRYSRRTVLKRASAMGLSAAAVSGVLGATGH